MIQVTGIINRNLTNSEAQKDTRLQIFNTLSLRNLLYECESWAFREQGKHRITKTKIEFMRRMAKQVTAAHRDGMCPKEFANSNVCLSLAFPWKQTRFQAIQMCKCFILSLTVSLYPCSLLFRRFKYSNTDRH